MNCPKGMVVDHVKHDALDNRKSKLRICTYSQNQMNRVSNIGTSKYKGVSFSKRMNKWNACIKINFKAISLGYYEKEKFAAKAYNKKAKELFGKYAYLNKIMA